MYDERWKLLQSLHFLSKKTKRAEDEKTLLAFLKNVWSTLADRQQKKIKTREKEKFEWRGTRRQERSDEERLK